MSTREGLLATVESESAVREEVDFVSGWLATAAGLRGEFETPERSEARPGPDFS